MVSIDTLKELPELLLSLLNECLKFLRHSSKLLGTSDKERIAYQSIVCGRLHQCPRLSSRLEEGRLRFLGLRDV